MTSLQFLKNELQALANNFPNVHIKYGYNNVIEAHIVELLPLIEYKTNKELDDAWIPVSLKFSENYSNEEVVFISSDSSLSLKTVLFEYNASACTEERLLSEVYSPLTQEIGSYTFPTIIPNGKLMASSIVCFLNTPVQDFANLVNDESSYLHAA